MKKIIRLTEADIHNIIRESVEKLIKEDAADHYFDWMDNKDYSQFDDERRELEHELDYNDSVKDYIKDRQINHDWNDLDSNTIIGNGYNMNDDTEMYSNKSNIANDYGFDDGQLSMMAQSDNSGERRIGQHSDWKSIKESTNKKQRKLYTIWH